MKHTYKSPISGLVLFGIVSLIGCSSQPEGIKESIPEHNQELYVKGGDSLYVNEEERLLALGYEKCGVYVGKSFPPKDLSQLDRLPRDSKKFDYIAVDMGQLYGQPFIDLSHDYAIYRQAKNTARPD